jgi:glycosyltransferase involved in cell wall biosynthesis
VHGDPPQLSTVIATRDRGASLGRTLQHLEAQQLDGLRWELIVVDNGSTDETGAVLDAFRDRLPLRIIQEPTPGKSEALNTALRSASGEMVVFTDDDVQPVSYWLSELWDASQRHASYSVFGGPISPIFPPDCPPWLRRHRFAGPLFTEFVPTLEEKPLPAGVVPLGPNCAVRKTALASARFDPRLGPQLNAYPVGADVDFALRLEAAGHVPMFVPKAIVRHVVRQEQLQPRWLLHRCYAWGRGVSYLYPDRTSLRVSGIPVNVLSWFGLSWWRERRSEVAHRLERSMTHSFVRGLLAEEHATGGTGSRTTMSGDLAMKLRRYYAGEAASVKPRRRAARPRNSPRPR